jgi:hypothetical protein
VKRRQFITVIGGAAAWPLAVRAQQPLSVVGFVDGVSPEFAGSRVAGGSARSATSRAKT